MNVENRIKNFLTVSTLTNEFVQGKYVEAEKDIEEMSRKEEEYRKKCARHLKNVLKKCGKGPLIKRSINEEIPVVNGHMTREELEEKVKKSLAEVLKDE